MSETMCAHLILADVLRARLAEVERNNVALVAQNERADEDRTALRLRLRLTELERDGHAAKVAEFSALTWNGTLMDYNQMASALMERTQGMARVERERDEHAAKRAEYASEARSLRVQLEGARKDRYATRLRLAEAERERCAKWVILLGADADLSDLLKEIMSGAPAPREG